MKVFICGLNKSKQLKGSVAKHFLVTTLFPSRTQCQDEVRILSGRTQKLKVAKWCWKQRNEHNLIYIYHKQCENMQNIQ